MNRIERITAGQVQVGDYIVEVDDDSLTTDSAINENYDAEEQSWLVVTATGGHSDIGWIDTDRAVTLRGSWDQLVWRRKSV